MQTWTFGPAGIYTATWDGTSKVTVTLTAGGAFVASFAAQSLAAAIASPEYQAILSPAPNSLSGLSLVAATPIAGFTLVNATPNILTWTAPNDGAQHRVAVFASLNITSNETGGQIALFWTLPNGQGANTGLYSPSTVSALPPASVTIIVQAGTAVILKQNSALTAGAAVLWAELWGS